MGVQLAKSAIDLGIVIRDSDASLAFYRDTLGFEHVADMPMPLGGGGTMHRLQCGDTLVKLVKFDAVPDARAPGGGIVGASGFRYFTMIVSNLAEIMKSCEDAGYKIAISIREARPGVTIGMVEDPDGNWVEFVQNG
ncbi:MAG: VOC family protein [Acidimicrobiia bacterium]|nr:VOC family protein [Acidimicrobiia bacterium]